MRYEVSEQLRTKKDATAIQQLLYQQFSKISKSVEKISDTTLIAKRVEVTFGSINRTDRTELKIYTKEYGYLVVADVNYKPSGAFWIFFVLALFSVGGWIIPLVMYLVQKNSVRTAIEKALKRVRDEADDQTGFATGYSTQPIGMAPSPSRPPSPSMSRSSHPALGSQQDQKLVTCPDCGNSVSRRAKVCPKCGGPVEFSEPPSILIICPDCGSQLKDPSKDCPNCGCPATEFGHQNKSATNLQRVKSEPAVATQPASIFSTAAATTPTMESGTTIETFQSDQLGNADATETKHEINDSQFSHSADQKAEPTVFLNPSRNDEHENRITPSGATSGSGLRFRQETNEQMTESLSKWLNARPNTKRVLTVVLGLVSVACVFLIWQELKPNQSPTTSTSKEAAPDVSHKAEMTTNRQQVDSICLQWGLYCEQAGILGLHTFKTLDKCEEIRRGAHDAFVHLTGKGVDCDPCFCNEKVERNPGVGNNSFAQAVDDLINKNIQAYGGLDKMKAINSMRVTGKIQGQAGIEIPMIVIKKRPNYMRVDDTFQGKNLAQAFDGQMGWQTPFMGNDPQKMTEDDLKDMEEQADFDGPLVDYKAKGNTVELVGKEDMEGTDTYKLKVTLKNGNVRYIYLDADNYLELKSSGKAKQEGTEYDGETLFSNFQTVDGLVLPFSIEGKINGQTAQQITISKVETNVPVDDSIFKMPAATQSQAAKQN